jgi:hypothetical protein
MSESEETMSTIDRREAIRRVSAMLGGVALVGGSALWTACAKDRGVGAYDSSGAFAGPDVALLDEIADTILPDTTRSPGAKAAKTGAFMAIMVTDCYTPQDQEIFRAGLVKLDEACKAAHGASFMEATPAQRLALLEGIDKATKDYMDAKQAEEPTHYFRMMKELALLGFFTSEIGYTRAMRYTESPGRFDPCAPLAPGDTLWGSHA